ncbi:restriction endonuclease subunit S [Leptospira meyeri]|uniref:restriction endonuclease subunit S n=1 Tax=Leptospira meyeri TaxID=29508 RepID=UPI00108350E2|nr:restriction endonuclease subunit S [Leptospira meyeri]TGL53683.1 restriction endonuclease subunit S [Leptospira meyeri]
MKQKEKASLKQLFPDLRFPEFQDAGNWEERPLGKAYSFIVTNSLSRDQLNYRNGEFKNIHYGDIHTKFSTLFDITKETVPYVNEGEAFNKIKTRTICEPGDIIFADASEDLADIGKSIEVVNLNNEKIISGLHTIHARPTKEIFVIGFGGYLFKSPKLRFQIQRIAQGAKVLGISASKLSLIDISFPSLPEQKKIADCLSSLDEVLSLESQKLQSLQSYKKGLLQNLFPAEGETVPKLRFPEFAGAGDWEERKLGDVCELTLRSVDKPKQGYLGLGVRSHGKGTFQKLEQDPKANSMDVLYEVHENDLIVSITFAWEGAVAIASKEDQGGLVSHRFPTYVFKPEETSSNFFRYIITKKSFVYKLGLISPGGAGRNRVMNKKDFLELKEYFPSLPEQQKIADCLSSVDALIQEQVERVEKLKSHKKGLLQGLFPVMGE